MIRHATILALCTAALSAIWASSLTAAPPGPVNSLRSTAAVELRLKGSAAVTGNLLRLSDLVELPEPTAYWQQQLDQPLAPTPREGQAERWTAEQIVRLLTLRGLAAGSYSIVGAESCEVRRSEQISAEVSTASASVLAGNQAVSPASYTAVNRAQASDQTARRNAEDAVRQYLDSAVGDAEGYEVTIDLPAEAMPHLMVRRNIVGVSGGQPPWDGQQRFTIHAQNRGSAYEIECVADLHPPRLVYAAANSLSRDHVLTVDDLKLVPKTRGRGGEAGVEQAEELVGKQLTRSLATGQIVEPEHLRAPRLIDANDAVEIQVQAGGLLVTSTGRALQAGGLDEVIAVEVLPHRSKVLARVRSPGLVAVIAAP